MPKKIVKIYFIHNWLLSFVERDINILSDKYRVRVVDNYKPFKKIWDNLRGVLWADVIYCWFSSISFVFPVFCAKLTGKKVIIVAGGYDVVKLPEINYGGMLGRFGPKGKKLLYNLADRIICVSKSNRREAIENACIKPDKISMIYHGFEAHARASSEKEPWAVTIGRVNEENLTRKGLRYFIEVAKFFPEIQFYLIGSVDDRLKTQLDEKKPPNLFITGYLDNRELDDILSCAKVYVQASMHEGFGCAVAEAMLYECIPVVSNCFALPEVVGAAGYLTEPGNLDDLRKKIGLALADNSGLGKKARLRVEQKFPISARKKALYSLIEGL